MSKLGILLTAVIVTAALWAGGEFLGLPVGSSIARVLGTDEPSAEECATEFEEGVRSSNPENAPFLRTGELRRAADDFCAEWLARPGSDRLTNETGPAVVIDVYRDKPRLYRDVCRLGVDADLAASKAYLAHVTRDQLRRYKRKFCRVSLQYLRAREPMVDLRALVRDHPTLLAPVVASGTQTEMLADPRVREMFTRRQLTVITRRASAKALRTGVFDVSGPRAFRDPRIDEPAFERILCASLATSLAVSHSASRRSSRRGGSPCATRRPRT